MKPRRVCIQMEVITDAPRIEDCLDTCYVRAEHGKYKFDVKTWVASVLRRSFLYSNFSLSDTPYKRRLRQSLLSRGPSDDIYVAMVSMEAITDAPLGVLRRHGVQCDEHTFLAEKFRANDVDTRREDPRPYNKGGSKNETA